MIDGKRILAHRYSYVLFNGSINYGKLIRHTCNNTSCVNPVHLKEGTVKDNSLDMIEARRQCYGEKNKNSKLKEADIHKIRSLRKEGFLFKEIASIFNVCSATIERIMQKKSWKYVG